MAYARSLISIAIRRMLAVAGGEDHEHLGEMDNGHSVVLDWVMGPEFRLERRLKFRIADRHDRDCEPANSYTSRSCACC
jgi:hypothetical protein